MELRRSVGKTSLWPNICSISSKSNSLPFCLFFTVSKNEAESKSSTEEIIPGGRIENLKTYSLEEVAKHNDASNRDLWVVYKEGVYDISDFVISHPGGDVICLAAGNSIEPFWEVSFWIFVN